MKNKGSITVFLCLCMVVCIGVTGVMLETARMYGCQSVLSMAKQTAAQSIEAAYNRALWQKYELLAWDGQLESDRQQTLKEAYQQWLAGELRPSTYGLYLYGMSVEDVWLQQYDTLLDENGRYLLEQMLDAEESRYSVVLLRLLEDTLSFLPSMSLPELGISLDKWLEGPTIHKLFADEEQEPVSDYRLHADCLPSQMLSGALQETAVEKALVCDYILRHCASYTDHKTEQLCYEVEYILGGKETDSLNLVSAARKLIKLRTGINFIQILSEEEMHTAAELLGTMIATCLTIPEAEELVTFLVEVGWAYKEAVRDAQDLYQGRYVALQKEPGEWHIWIHLPKGELSKKKVTLADLNDMLGEYLKESTTDVELGHNMQEVEYSSNRTILNCLQDGNWNYECYLFLLLYLQDNSIQMGRMMDVIQLELSAEYPAFWLPDCCVGFSMGMRTSFRPVFSAFSGQIGIWAGRRQLTDVVTIRFSDRYVYF